MSIKNKLLVNFDLVIVSRESWGQKKNSESLYLFGSDFDRV